MWDLNSQEPHLLFAAGLVCCFAAAPRHKMVGGHQVWMVEAHHQIDLVCHRRCRCLAVLNDLSATTATGTPRCSYPQHMLHTATLPCVANMDSKWICLTTCGLGMLYPSVAAVRHSQTEAQRPMIRFIKPPHARATSNIQQRRTTTAQTPHLDCHIHATPTPLVHPAK